MARFIPPLPPEGIDNAGERQVASLLAEQLDDRWLVFHSYPWLRPDRHRKGVTLRKGETDFLLLSPDHGLLVLEVKGGGQFETDPETGEWFRTSRGERQPIADPFRQARDGLYTLAPDVQADHQRGVSPSALSDSFAAGRLPCPHGYAVVFPHSRTLGRLPVGVPMDVVVTGEDIDRIGTRVAEILRRYGTIDEKHPFTSRDYQTLKDRLLPSFQTFVLLASQVATQEAQLIRLTEEQQRAVEGLWSNPRVVVKGVAGSGKTLLAVQRARGFAAEGKKTLFLCYNRVLADYLGRQLEGLPIHVRNFHRLCYEVVRDARLKWSGPLGTGDGGDTSEFWQETAAELLLQAVEDYPERFDAIVVDEAQDFHETWWVPIDDLGAAGSDTPLYLFLDPQQNLFGTPVAVPKGAFTYDLRVNCRNTQAISAACGRVLNLEIPVSEHAPKGEAPEVLIGRTSQDRRNLGKKRIERWLGEGGLNPSQVAVLSPFKKENGSFAEVGRIKNTTLTTDVGAWEAGEGVLFSTIRGFKGLEADAILLLDVNRGTPAMLDRDFYVGCSRAKHLLSVVASASPGL